MMQMSECGGARRLSAIVALPDVQLMRLPQTCEHAADRYKQHRRIGSAR